MSLENDYIMGIGREEPRITPSPSLQLALCCSANHVPAFTRPPGGEPRCWTVRGVFRPQTPSQHQEELVGR